MDMDSTAEIAAFPRVKYKNRKRTCTVCDTPGPSLFTIPSDENRQKEWFLALKWDIPKEKLQFILRNARVCNKHFPEICFSSTLQHRLNKFACPQVDNLTSNDPPSLPSPASAGPENLLSTASASVLPSTTSQCLSINAKDMQPLYSRSLSCSPTTSVCNSSGHLKVTPKTRKIKTLLSNVSKLRRRLYQNRSSARLMGQLQAKLADKPYLYEFISSQLRMICKSNKGRRWSAKEKSFALQIYLHSPSAYRILRKYFAFPCKATLHRYTFNVSKAPGFCSNLMKCLKMQSSRMSDSEKMCVLSIDEMSIKPGLAYAADLDCVDGFTTFREDCKGKPPNATQALVFMARGIIKNWKQVLGYYFTSPSDKFSIKLLVERAIDILQSCDLEVISIVCDQGPKNRGLVKELKVTTEKPYFIYNKKKVYTMYDPPHLLKSVRNNLKNHGISYEDTSLNSKPRKASANWKHIEKLYAMDSKDELCACPKLTKKHMAVSGLKKMNVKLAAQVLSHSVASALNLYVAANRIESNAIDTARFVKKMDTLFDTVNSRTLYHQKKELRAVTKNSCHIKIWKEMIPWIKTWEIRSHHSGKKIVAFCKKGWILTLKAFIGICEDLLQRNKFILTNHFNQDVVENTFSSVRRRGGFRDNPDCYEFRQIIHKVIIANFLKQSNGKNCQDDDAYTLIDFSNFKKCEINDILNSEDSTEESGQDEVDNLNHVTTEDVTVEKVLDNANNLNLATAECIQDGSSISNTLEDVSLNSTSENVLCYIAGYFAKKYVSDECVECQKLVVDESKILDNHTVFLDLKVYDECKFGLKWPSNDLFKYFNNLHKSFMSNFNLFYEKGVSKKFQAVLQKVNLDFFASHLEHKDKAQKFFVSSFIRMMIRHKIKRMNDAIKPTFCYKKMKYS